MGKCSGIVQLLLVGSILFGCGGETYFEDVAIPAKQSKRGDYGLVRLDGSLAVDFEIDERPSLMISNRAHFFENDQLKFVDENGKISPTEYLSALYFNEGVALVQIADGRLAFIDKDFKIVKQLDGVEEAGYVSEGLFKFKSQEGHWGFMNLNGDIVLKPKYAGAGSFSEGFAVVIQNDLEEKTKLLGVIDQQGKEVVKIGSKYSSIGPFSEGLAAFEEEDEIGYLNSGGEEVIKNLEWKRALPFLRGTATVQGRDNEFGLVDLNGNMLINTREKFPIRFYNGLSIYVDPSTRRGGFMDKDRKLVTRAEFDELLPFFNNGAWAKDGGEWYYVDNNGKDMGKDEVPRIKLLYHEDFFESLIFNNRPFDIEETLESKYVNIKAFCEEFISPLKKVLFLSEVTAENGVPEIENIINNFKEEDQDELFLSDKLSHRNTRLDTDVFLSEKLVFDKNLHFAIRADYGKNIFSKNETALVPNPEALLRTARITLDLKDKAKGRRIDLIDYMEDHLKGMGYSYNEQKGHYENSMGQSVKISGKYNKIYVAIMPNYQ